MDGGRRQAAGKHRYPGAAALAAVMALSAGPASAQPAEELLGLWHRNDFAAVAIEPERLIRIAGEELWVHSAETCETWFEHHGETLTGAVLLETYDFPEFVDPEGSALHGDLAGRLDPETAYATLRSACCCLGEIPSNAVYVGLEAGTLLAIVSGDGVFGLDTYRREVPPPSHDGLSGLQRRDIQQALRERGHYRGGIDGIFGPGTDAAIRSYQSEIGAEPTGILTASQIIRLYRGE